MIVHGDCVALMAELPEASVDAIVTDPPYGLEFMGKEWDRLGGGISSTANDTDPFALQRGGSLPFGGGGQRVAYGASAKSMQEWHEAWAREALRILKPGGHLLAFGGTRTYHRLACAIEDAGFEIRDCLAWLYGSGFPKSLSPYRSMLSRLCPSTEHAQRAVLISEWHPVASLEAKAPTALALVEILPEGELGVAIRTGGGVDSFARTVMPSSALTMVGMNLSTEPSWLNCSAATLDGTSMSITETASRLTTDPRIWNSYRSLPTPPVITRDEWRPDGCSCDAWSVAESLNGDGGRWSDTPILIAPASVTGRVVPTKPLGSALKPSHEPIVLARKPLAGTVAANVLEHGTGALNVDGCRIDSGADYHDLDVTQGATAHTSYNPRSEPSTFKPGAGRWPANVVLSHTEECVPVGTRRVKGGVWDAKPKNSTPGGGGKTMGTGWRNEAGTRPGFVDADGMETVQAWECHPECPVRMLDEQTGELGKSQGGNSTALNTDVDVYGAWGRDAKPDGINPGYGDSGGASRFLYVAKSSSAERSAGLDDKVCECTSPQRATYEATEEGDSCSPTSGSGSKLTDRSPRATRSTTETETRRTTISPTSNSSPPLSTSESIRPTTGEPVTDGNGAATSAASGNRQPSSTTTSVVKAGLSTADADPATSGPSSQPSSSAVCASCGGVVSGAWKNTHPLEPTVKPIELMRWLVRLVTPPGGTVLDPFTGSGTTGCAAVLEGFNFVGMEREEEYVKIAEARIAWWSQHPNGVEIVKALEADRERRAIRDTGQLDLLS